MIKKILFGAFMLFCLLPASAVGISTAEKRKAETEVSNAFERIITLWKDESFEALYEYGDKESRSIISRDGFVGTMKGNAWVLACCRETVNDVEITVGSGTRATVKARVGYAARFGGVDTVFIDQTFPMTFQDGDWRTDLRKISYPNERALPEIFRFRQRIPR